MPTPMICKEFKKPVVKHERRVNAAKDMQVVDDASLNKLLEHRLKIHALTWKELAKR